MNARMIVEGQMAEEGDIVPVRLLRPLPDEETLVVRKGTALSKVLRGQLDYIPRIGETVAKLMYENGGDSPLASEHWAFYERFG